MSTVSVIVFSSSPAPRPPHFKVFKAGVHHAFKARGGGLPCSRAKSVHFLAASSRFVLGGRVAFPLATTLSNLARPAGPRRLVGDDGLGDESGGGQNGDEYLPAGRPGKLD